MLFSQRQVSEIFIADGGLQQGKSLFEHMLLMAH